MLVRRALAASLLATCALADGCAAKSDVELASDASTARADAPQTLGTTVGADAGHQGKGSTFDPIRVACGQTQPVVDGDGDTWSQDEDFTGGTGAVTAGQAVAGTNTSALYDGQRYGTSGSFQYSFDVPAGQYSVVLKFTESYVTAAGQRVFDVSINGSRVLHDFDIYAAAGGPWIAVDRTVPATVGADGKLTIEFEPGSANNPKVDAIEIRAGSAPDAGATVDASDACAPAPSGFGLKVSGSTLVSTESGAVVPIVGTNLSGLETGMVDRWPMFQTAGTAAWSSVVNYGGSGLNTVRLPLNEASWLNYTCYDPGSPATPGESGELYAPAAGGGFTPDPDQVYQATVKQAVADATAAGLYVILDLHWGSPNDPTGQPLCPIGQPAYADSDHSLTFWRQVADTFRDNPAVIFELFNEPFGSNDYTSWVTGDDGAGPDTVYLLQGGSYPSFLLQDETAGAAASPYTFPFSFQVAGTQAMVDAIRGECATNVILASPIGWAGELETWLASKPSDRLGQLGAAWHVYDYAHGTAPPLAVLAAGYPVVITETFGFDSALDGGVDSTGYDWAASEGIGYLWWGWNDWNDEDLNGVLSQPPWYESAAPSLPGG